MISQIKTSKQIKNIVYAKPSQSFSLAKYNPHTGTYLRTFGGSFSFGTISGEPISTLNVFFILYNLLFLCIYRRMKHIKLFEGWLDSLTSGFSGKSKPAPEDYSYQGSKFRDAKDMWDHPERYNKEMYRDHDAALQELEDDMGTREILMLSPYRECKELSAIHQILRLVALNSNTSMGTASFADSEREKDPCDNEGHLLKIDPDRGRFSKENTTHLHDLCL
jgi:hypothetical protein